MTQIFGDDGNVVPVTKVLAGPCQITQIKKKEGKVQLGFTPAKISRLNNAKLGHLKDLDPVRNLREFKSDEVAKLKRGDKIDIKTFEVGDKVAVIGISKGKGFQGVVKRHGFKGSKATHGNKDQLRASGSIGATGPQKVFKGMRMAGRMGSDRVTVKNLEIVKINEETLEIYLKGAVPGARNGLLLISAKGDLKIINEENNKQEKNIDEGKDEIKTIESVEEVKEDSVEKNVDISVEETKEEK